MMYDLRKNLYITPLANGNYILKKEYKIKLNNGDFVIIPNGYETNGADIPRIFWRIYPPYSPEYMPAVIIHDFLCDKAVSTALNKKQLHELFLYADNVFKEILEKLNINKSKVKIFYNSVRLWHKIKY